MREIEAFLAVAEELHFGRAAERLSLSTSRVSHQVRTLERRLRTPLFERTSRSVRLTPQGEHLFAEVRPALVRIERALEETRAAAGLRGEILRIGFSTTLPRTLAPELVQAFEKQYPACRIVQSAHPTTDLFRWLGSQWPIDTFVTWMPGGRVPVVSELSVGPVIAEVQRAVILGAHHPLGAQASIDLEELADHEVIYPDLPAWYGDFWVPPESPSGRPMRLRRLNTGYVEEVLALVADGGLAHLTFTSLLESYRAPGVVSVALTGIPPAQVRAVWPRGARSAALAQFVAMAADRVA